MRDYFGVAGTKLSAPDRVRMRAAVKAALANPDVKRLITGLRRPLKVDEAGQAYFDHSEFSETLLESALDQINIANFTLLEGRWRRSALPGDSPASATPAS